MHYNYLLKRKFLGHLERQFRGDDLEKPQDKKSCQSKSYCNAYLPVCGHLKDCDKVYNVSCQENEDANKKCQLSSLLEDES